MILPDVNVLVHAFHRDAPEHEAYATWLNDLTAGRDELALAEPALVGFLRIVTNARIFAAPAPTEQALAFVNALIAAPRGRWLAPTRAVWSALGRFAGEDTQIRGNLVPDAWLAALAVEHGCRLATRDRGFGRFPGLEYFDPAAA